MKSKYLFSIIIPVWNEKDNINRIIEHIYLIRPQKDFEIIVIDGHPEANTIQTIINKSIITLKSPLGRAKQMNTGAKKAKGDILIFLHADSYLPNTAFNKILYAIKHNYKAGAFELSIRSNRSKNLFLRLTASTTSLRSRMTRIPYGDQAIFMQKEFFKEIGGFKDMPILEDVEIMKRIKKRKQNIIIFHDKVETSSRQWINKGMFKYSLQNKIVSLLYMIGVSAEKIAEYVKKRNNNKPGDRI